MARECIRVLENFCIADRARAILLQVPHSLLSEKVCNVSCNALFDTQIIDYCKIFYDKNSKIYIDRVMVALGKAKDDWLNGTEISSISIDCEKNLFRNYRDKFLVHRDKGDDAIFPCLKTARLICKTLHDYILATLRDSGLSQNHQSYSNIYSTFLTDQNQFS